MARKGIKAETNLRVAQCARILANGGKRSDCLLYASENWGVSDRSVDSYIKLAREQMKADWDLKRPQMVADLLSQCSTLQMEARQKGHLSVALGAINTAAKLAQLVS